MRAVAFLWQSHKPLLEPKSWRTALSEDCMTKFVLVKAFEDFEVQILDDFLLGFASFDVVVQAGRGVDF